MFVAWSCSLLAAVKRANGRIGGGCAVRVDAYVIICELINVAFVNYPVHFTSTNSTPAEILLPPIIGERIEAEKRHLKRKWKAHIRLETYKSQDRVAMDVKRRQPVKP